MKCHPLAELFPMMQGEAFESFCEDIRARGQLVPITVDGSLVLDGRNRLRACEQLGKPVKQQQFSSMGLAITAEEFIWSMNRERRHMTPDQLAAIAMKWRPQMLEEGRLAMAEGGKAAGVSRPKKGLEVLPQPISGSRNKTRAKLAALAGVTEGRIQTVEKIHDKPELLEKVAAGEMKLAEAVREARGEPQRSKKQEINENSAKRRMVQALSSIEGACVGLTTLKIDNIQAACEDGEIRTWAEMARSLAGQLRNFARDLEGNGNVGN